MDPKKQRTVVSKWLDCPGAYNEWVLETDGCGKIEDYYRWLEHKARDLGKEDIMEEYSATRIREMVRDSLAVWDETWDAIVEGVGQAFEDIRSEAKTEGIFPHLNLR